LKAPFVRRAPSLTTGFGMSCFDVDSHGFNCGEKNPKTMVTAFATRTATAYGNTKAALATVFEQRLFLRHASPPEVIRSYQHIVWFHMAFPTACNIGIASEPARVLELVNSFMSIARLFRSSGEHRA